jgi:hypothetical protein
LCRSGKRNADRHVDVKYISKFLHDSVIAFNVTNTRSYEKMVEAIGQYGHGLKPANYHGVRGPYLNEVINDVSELRKKHGQDWQIYGSTFSCQ